MTVRAKTGTSGRGTSRVPPSIYDFVADEGTVLNQRPVLNFTGGGVTASDNPAQNRTDVTIPLGGGLNPPVDPTDDWKICYALGGNLSYTLILRTDGTSITSVPMTVVGVGAAMTVSAQDALITWAAGNTGGSLSARAGNASNAGTGPAIGGVASFTGGIATQTGIGAATTTGGNAVVAGGTATGFGVTGTVTGGSVILRPGVATLGATQTHGTTQIEYGGAAFCEFAGTYLRFAAGLAQTNIDQAGYAGGIGAPIVGAAMTLTAQSVGVANAGFLNTGGALTVSSGGAINSATNDATSGNMTTKSADVITGGGAGSDMISGHVYLTSGTVTSTGGVGSTATSGNVYIGCGVASGAATNTQGSVIFTSPVSLGSTDLFWQETVLTPTLWQISRTATGTGATMLYHAQDSLIAGGVNQGGPLNVRAGNATANLTNNATGGAASLTGGLATTAGGAASAAVGGNTTVAAGGATAGVAGAGSTAVGGNLILSSGLGQGAATNTNGAIWLQIGLTTRLFVGGLVGSHEFYWADGYTVNMYQAGRAAAGAAYATNFHSQNVSGAFTSVGGALTVYGGDNSCANGAVAQAGGAATFRGGNVSGAGGTNTGGNVYVLPGGASGGGTNYAGNTYIGGDGAAPLGTVDATHGNVYFYCGLTAVANFNLLGGAKRLSFDVANTFNSVEQYYKITGGTGGQFSVAAQDIQGGAGVNTGGELIVRSGNSVGIAGQLASGGAATFRAGIVSSAGTTVTGGLLTANGGDITAVFSVTGIGGALIARGGNIGSVGTPATPILASVAGAATFQGGDCWSTGTAGAYQVTGGQGTLRGGNVTFSAAGAGTIAQAGHVLVTGGTATGAATNRMGNVAIHANPASWQNGEKILFLGNATTVPIGNPVSGVFIWSDGSAKGRGDSGTVTTFIAATPHCPRCKRDFALEWENDKYGGKLSVCVPCMMAAMQRAGIEPSDYAISQLAA